MFKKKYNLKELKIRREDTLEKLDKGSSYKFFIVKSLYFIFFTLIISKFCVSLYTYILNSTYEDKKVYIKEMSLGYNVYGKDATEVFDNFNNVKFYNTESNDNVRLIGIINNDIIYSSNDGNNNYKVILLKKNTTLRQKTETEVIEDINIKGFLKENNNIYILNYIKKDGDNYKYCIKQNSIDFNKNENTLCIKRKKGDEKFLGILYKKYIFITIGKDIYIINKNSNKINLRIFSYESITNISKNKNNNIRIITKKNNYIINSLILDYYLLKSQRDKRVYKINLDKIK